MSLSTSSSYQNCIKLTFSSKFNQSYSLCLSAILVSLLKMKQIEFDFKYENKDETIVAITHRICLPPQQTIATFFGGKKVFFLLKFLFDETTWTTLCVHPIKHFPSSLAAGRNKLVFLTWQGFSA
jgi:hypothetical protein